MANDNHWLLALKIGDKCMARLSQWIDSAMGRLIPCVVASVTATRIRVKPDGFAGIEEFDRRSGYRRGGLGGELRVWNQHEADEYYRAKEAVERIRKEQEAVREAYHKRANALQSLFSIEFSIGGEEDADCWAISGLTEQQVRLIAAKLQEETEAKL